MEPALETHRSKKMEQPLFTHAMSNSPWLSRYLEFALILIDYQIFHQGLPCEFTARLNWISGKSSGSIRFWSAYPSI